MVCARGSIRAAGFLTWLTAWGEIEVLVLPNTWNTLLTAAGIVVLVLCLMTVPIASGIAILRYRLYDIDLIINRTLVYGALTAVLALVYVGGVVGIGGLVRDATGGQDNSLVTAATTLVVAAVFRPARARIQALVDRRFYRREYDATQTVETFSARLRDEIDLDAMRADLMRIVQETMQPTGVSLWLRRSSTETTRRSSAATSEAGHM